MVSNHKFKYTLFGFIFGLFFPLISQFLISIESLNSFETLIFIINLAPFVLGGMGFIIGVKQEKLTHLNDQLEERIQKGVESFEDLSNKYELILNSAADGICGIDERGLVLFMNRAGLNYLSLKEEDLLGKEINEFISVYSSEGPKGENLFTPLGQRAHADGNRVIHNHKFRTSKGIEVLVDYSLSPIFKKEGDFGGHVLIFKDVSEQNKLRNQLLHSAKLASVGELAAGVGHEINNPLSILQMSAKSMQKENQKLANDHIQKNIDKQLNSIIRIKDIVDGLRLFAYSDLSSIESVSIHEVIHETLSLVKNIYEKNGFKINTSLEAKDDLVKCNAGKVQQVIVNLLSNAKDSMEEEKDDERVINIVTSSSGESFTLIVTDTGHGIEELIQDKVFEPFFTTKTRGQGTGLGLGLCKSILNEMNATIDFNSDEQGTSFFVRFPLER